QGAPALPERVAPAFGRADVGIAKPDGAFEGLPRLAILTFDPEARRHHGCLISVQAHDLRAVVFDLTFIDYVLVARGVQKLLARVPRPGPYNENHVLVQDSIHDIGVVALDRRLKCDI